MSINAKIKAHRIFRYLEQSQSSVDCCTIKKIFELFWFNIEVSMQLFQFLKHNRKIDSGYLESCV